jgi:hypothetical protein
VEEEAMKEKKQRGYEKTVNGNWVVFGYVTRMENI